MAAPHPPAYGIAPPGFRLPDQTSIGPVRLQVGDLDRSVDYYCGLLGLALRERHGAQAALGVTGAEHPLLRLDERAGIAPAPRRGAFGLFHFAILLPQRADLGRFAAQLSTFSVRAGMADHLVSEALYLTDPDGLGIEVYADRPRAAWRTQGRELAMTTDPLDLQNLIDAGAGRPWDGMPAGTVMGHVHLHVGDLPAAERFYHAALGFDKTVWSYPGALFMSAGGYHHHLATNTWSPGPSPAPDQAQLLEWSVVVPHAADAAAAATSLANGGYATRESPSGWTAADPWGTNVRITTPQMA